MVRVFVYGTLLRAGSNHGVLERLGARFLGEAKTVEARVLVDLGPYPALLSRKSDEPREPTTATHRVCGELFELTEDALAELDAFEGCPDLFARAELEVVVDGRPMTETAFVYELARRPPRNARPIPGGRYAGGGRRLPKGASADQLDD